MTCEYCREESLTAVCNICTLLHRPQDITMERLKVILQGMNLCVLPNGDGLIAYTGDPCRYWAAVDLCEGAGFNCSTYPNQGEIIIW